MDFQGGLEGLINECSRENDSDTPDFILAQYVKSCLDAYSTAVRACDRWFQEGELGKSNGNLCSEQPALYTTSYPYPDTTRWVG